MQFKTITPTLEVVGAVYYPHLSKAVLLEKARNHDFPFACYRIDKSQKAPYFVNLTDLSDFLVKALNENSQFISTNIQHVCKKNDQGGLM